ncbi:MAG: helix-turn-helix transcriptional regulator [Lachnospiraceae bacterium]|nr:helix-turn-helix transcriptional regulator [Lachnospiraceae bacterium]
MIFAYDQNYLSDATANLGEMTEYAVEACGQDMDWTLRCFIISGFAKRFQIGDPHVVSGMSGTELFMAVMDKCGIGCEYSPKPFVRYDTGVYYWIGYILAYYQWRYRQSFQNITSIIKSDDLIRIYPALHTVSEEQAAEKLSILYQKRAQISRLQAYRKRLGLTQAQLAKRSGVNLRTLQQYEVGDKDINKAASGSVIDMAHILYCQPEDIMNFTNDYRAVQTNQLR